MTKYMDTGIRNWGHHCYLPHSSATMRFLSGLIWKRCPYCLLDDIQSWSRFRNELLNGTLQKKKMQCLHYLRVLQSLLKLLMRPVLDVIDVFSVFVNQKHGLDVTIFTRSGWLSGVSSQDTDTSMRASPSWLHQTLITSQRSHFQISSNWGLSLQHKNLGVIQFSPQQQLLPKEIPQCLLLKERCEL